MSPSQPKGRFVVTPLTLSILYLIAGAVCASQNSATAKAKDEITILNFNLGNILAL